MTVYINPAHVVSIHDGDRFFEKPFVVVSMVNGDVHEIDGMIADKLRGQFPSELLMKVPEPSQ